MTERCGCSDQGDPVVFGPCKKCHPKACACEYDGIDESGRIKWRTAKCDEHCPKADRYVPQERPWQTTLGEDETHD